MTGAQLLNGRNLGLRSKLQWQGPDEEASKAILEKLGHLLFGYLKPLME